MPKQKTKKYELLDGEGVHEYTIKVEQSDKETSYTIHASKSSLWNDHYKGELILKLIDNGDQVIFEQDLANPMGYDVIGALHTLLSFVNGKENYTPIYNIHKKVKKKNKK